MTILRVKVIAFVILILFGSNGCSGKDESTTALDESKLRVLATTTLIGDIVGHVGGDTIDLKVLIPPGVDVHGYEAAPRDVSLIAEADLVFINGLGLETSIDNLIRQAELNNIVSISSGIEPRSSGEDIHDDDEDGHDHASGIDPHVWFDPQNILIWVDNAVNALSELDPENGLIYETNGEAYRQIIEDLDQWIASRIQVVPEERRLLVTDHDTLAYFADRYGLELIGSIIPGNSTLSEPSSQSLANLSELVENRGVEVIFVGPGSNQRLAQQLVVDTNARLVTIKTSSLGEPGSPTGDYIGFMESNVNIIVDALVAENDQN